MDLKQTLRDYGVQVADGGSHRHVREGWIGVDCPWCGKGTGKNHLGIELSTHRCTCWKCGPHRLGDTLVALTGLPLPTVLGWKIKRGPTPHRLPQMVGTLEVPSGVGQLLRPHLAYLKKRGLDPQQIQDQWGVQAIGLSSYLQWRLFIPIHFEMEMVSWTTRSIGDDGTRYISAEPDKEQLHHRDLLYGEDCTGPSIVVVEGPIDVWAIGPGAVATMGLATTPAQVEKIARHPYRVICFDAETTAQKRAHRLARELQGFPGTTTVVELESGKDAGSADPQEVEELQKFLTK